METSFAGKVSVVTVQLLKSSDKIFSAEEWVEIGKYKGFIKRFKLRVGDITGLSWGFMDEAEFKKLPK